MKLKDKVAIITGSSRGIGKAMAIAFSKEGARVVITARSVDKGALPGTIYETERKINEAGGESFAVKCDVSKESEVRNLVSQVIEKFGKIDILVNNAAVGYYKSLQDTPLKHWDLVMKVNVRGPFICCKEVIPKMIEQKNGCIINISSSAARDVFSRVKRPDGEKRTVGTTYGASKAALERFTAGLAAEVAENNISVFALKPEKPTYSEGVAFWNKDINENDLVSPDLYMTKSAIILAQKQPKKYFGKALFDTEICSDFGNK